MEAIANAMAKRIAKSGLASGLPIARTDGRTNGRNQDTHKHDPVPDAPTPVSGTEQPFDWGIA